MVKLTTRFLESVQPTPGQRLELSDDQVTGLYLRVAPAGGKSWMVRYTAPDGRRCKLGLGRFPVVGLADARLRARKAALAVAEGHDPAGERRTERRAQAAQKVRTLSDLWRRYEAERMPSKRETTRAYQTWLWEKHIEPRLGKGSINTIDRSTVRAAFREVGETATTTANRALSLVRHLLNYAVDEELILASPLAKIGKLFVEESRDRVLTVGEIEALWGALERAPGDLSVPVSKRVCLAIQLALCLGSRAGEVAGLHADEIDQAGRMWIIPAERFKGGRAHTVPLSPLAVSLLEAAFETGVGEWAGFAFPNSRDKAAPMDRRSLTRATYRVVRYAGIEAATPHDLRRTMATTLASERIGAAPHVVSAVLGHNGEGPRVTWVYNRHRYDVEKRHALVKWAKVLEDIAARADGAGLVADVATKEDLLQLLARPARRAQTSGSNDRQRLFVPLKGGPYDHFRSGQKRWELRRCRGQFTPKHVRTGRPVELRRGYSVEQPALWGTVGQVVVAPNVEELFQAVPWRSVVPQADDFSGALDAAEQALGSSAADAGPVIGFEIRLPVATRVAASN